MEQNNNQQTIDTIFNDIEAQTKEEVHKELQEKGYLVLKADFNAGVEICKVVDKFEADIKAIEQQIEYNTKTYSVEKCKVDNYLLMQDKIDLQDEAVEKIDFIVEKNQERYNQDIQSKQQAKEYKEAKMECLQTLGLLKGVDIPTAKLLEILEPVIEVQDIKTLELAGILLQGNKSNAYAIESTINSIESAKANRELFNIANTMKDFIRNGQDTLSVFTIRQRFKS